MAVIVVLIDGVGLAPAGSHNPVAAGFVRLRQFLGAPLTDALDVAMPTLIAKPIDATLGVPGLPQSGSGHVAIWGGYNAAALNGRHQPSYPTIAMRERLAVDNLLLRTNAIGRRVAWANAYLPGYLEAIERRRTRHTAGTWCAIAAELPLRGVDKLLAGTAVSWDLTQQFARTRPGATDLPLITAEDSGARLADLAQKHDLVAFETYLPDLAGHDRIPLTVPDALDLVDHLLAGVIGKMGESDTLVVVSDHGNSEDATTLIHTRNPVPLLAIGPAVPVFASVGAIDGVAGAILRTLGAADHQA
jgi:2,3-bisphosphoglycerate-independent phosphoglycerate mutase